MQCDLARIGASGKLGENANRLTFSEPMLCLAAAESGNDGSVLRSCDITCRTPLVVDHRDLAREFGKGVVRSEGEHLYFAKLVAGQRPRLWLGLS